VYHLLSACDWVMLFKCCFNRTSCTDASLFIFIVINVRNEEVVDKSHFSWLTDTVAADGFLSA
jgi:hypothetical protein